VKRDVQLLRPEGVGGASGYSYVADVRAGRLLYIAGQVALDTTGAVVGVGDIGAQTQQCFRNIEQALAAVGGTARDIKLNYYVVDVSGLPAIRSARDSRAHIVRTTLPDCPPSAMR
jgi:enamine deaminase RidA (YjgF/YER057c/UK114 family)